MSVRSLSDDQESSIGLEEMRKLEKSDALPSCQASSCESRCAQPDAWTRSHQILALPWIL
jgi:hypothetical protein